MGPCKDRKGGHNLAAVTANTVTADVPVAISTRPWATAIPTEKSRLRPVLSWQKVEAGGGQGGRSGGKREGLMAIEAIMKSRCFPN